MVEYIISVRRGKGGGTRGEVTTVSRFLGLYKFVEIDDVIGAIDKLGNRSIYDQDCGYTGYQFEKLQKSNIILEPLGLKNSSRYAVNDCVHNLTLPSRRPPNQLFTSPPASRGALSSSPSPPIHFGRLKPSPTF